MRTGCAVSASQGRSVLPWKNTFSRSVFPEHYIYPGKVAQARKCDANATYNLLLATAAVRVKFMCI